MNMTDGRVCYITSKGDIMKGDGEIYAEDRDKFLKHAVELSAPFDDAEFILSTEVNRINEFSTNPLDGSD